MRVRRLGLRLLGLALVGAWGSAALLILLAYRPGGPLDVVVGITMLLPLAIAAAGVVWPPLARQEVTHALLFSLGVATLLVLLPSIGGVLNQLHALGSQTLMPSLEAAYPWLLALVGTSLFTGFGQARRMVGGTAGRPQRLRLGVAIATALTLIAGSAFGVAAVANDLSLRDVDGPTIASRFGPTDLGPDVEPPACNGALASGPTSRILAHFVGSIDGRLSGTIDLAGQRSGPDFRWLAYVATNRELGQHGQARLGESAWIRSPAHGWERAEPWMVARSTLDLQAIESALTEGARATAEDYGIEVIERAPARRCRVSVDGPTFRTTFPQVQWLVGDADLERWRGQLDYWVFLDGTLGQVAGSVNGEAVGLEDEAIQGKVEVLITATERGRDVAIRPPAA
ncbi:MAG: hypothetical protein M3P84_12600 [Chloroflexota bacterium]|nr:hypothetical protein [Chloroflexota bacterium]